MGRQSGAVNQNQAFACGPSVDTPASETPNAVNNAPNDVLEATWTATAACGAIASIMVSEVEPETIPAIVFICLADPFKFSVDFTVGLDTTGQPVAPATITLEQCGGLDISAFTGIKQANPRDCLQ